MKKILTNLEGLFVCEPTIYKDHRGWFFESFERSLFPTTFIQDNHSYSKEKGTIRGLHFQLPPYAQSKLIRCTKGSIFDVVVDLRKDSMTFGERFSIMLDEENKKQLFIPKGFAHGFMTLTDDVEVQYKVDATYHPESDSGIIWNDPTLNIAWPTQTLPIISKKGSTLLSFKKTFIPSNW